MNRIAVIAAGIAALVACGETVFPIVDIREPSDLGFRLAFQPYQANEIEYGLIVECESARVGVLDCTCYEAVVDGLGVEPADLDDEAFGYVAVGRFEADSWIGDVTQPAAIAQVVRSSCALSVGYADVEDATEEPSETLVGM